MKYLLDSNVFIEAKNRYYSFKIAPGFWNWLEIFTEEQSFLTIREVRNEITENDDELKEWISEFPLNCFIEADREIQDKMREVTNYVTNNKRFSRENKNFFLSRADPWLIATAMTGDYAVVTHETKAGPGTKKVKIPNICETFNVEYITIFDLMKIQKVSLKI
ncbi:DUF4411 family protein [Methanoplanus endosymbiosus]|uniref:DUF4411 family protein n=1 Tax=Methanoplanus endosymbiosus TaxID=33865 RepID=A0A9E7PN40_9EURY|nr:DUF4411 family protein [Methanoplanus endosymbiosus]UUX91989.1 DUF4411 family protein [Methanoplanus endosymbiosus]